LGNLNDAISARSVPPSAGGSHPIRHVVLMIQENRSFDNLFATFPGAEGSTQGKTSDGRTIKLKAADLSEPCDFGHSWQGFLRDYDAGAMDGFDLETGSRGCSGRVGTAPYQFVKPAEIESYWDLASRYVLSDHMFQTQGSGSFTAHQDLIRGGTDVDPADSLVDYPSAKPWGCDAPRRPKTVTSLLRGPGITVHAHVQLRYLLGAGPYPCLSYVTLRDRLDAKAVSWAYYSPPVPYNVGAYWNAFDAIKAVRYGPEWSRNVKATKTFFSDVSKGSLPAMSWLVPDETNSDHPGSGSDTGPSWVANVVNSIGKSKYWKSTAIVVVWDDWGGFYDHVRPPFFDNSGGLGFRVPMLVVSAYTRRGHSSNGGYVSHTRYEFGSILRFVEDEFGLNRLYTTDTRAASIVDCFDFTQPARPFSPIPSRYSRAFFERQPPSYKPVDSE
jgi:phospholipase C